jgi:hypothetical protein
MKITATQLKKIIAEEVKKVAIKEAPDASAKSFYSKKAYLLSLALDNIDVAMSTLSKVSELDETSPEGEDTDVRSAMMDLTSVREFVEGIHSAVEVMVK